MRLMMMIGCVAISGMLAGAAKLPAVLCRTELLPPKLLRFATATKHGIGQWAVISDGDKKAIEERTRSLYADAFKLRYQSEQWCEYGILAACCSVVASMAPIDPGIRRITSACGAVGTSLMMAYSGLWAHRSWRKIVEHVQWQTVANNVQQYCFGAAARTGTPLDNLGQRDDDHQQSIHCVLERWMERPQNGSVLPSGGINAFRAAYKEASSAGSIDPFRRTLDMLYAADENVPVLEKGSDSAPMGFMMDDDSVPINPALGAPPIDMYTWYRNVWWNVLSGTRHVLGAISSGSAAETASKLPRLILYEAHEELVEARRSLQEREKTKDDGYRSGFDSDAD